VIRSLLAVDLAFSGELAYDRCEELKDGSAATLELIHHIVRGQIHPSRRPEIEEPLDLLRESFPLQWERSST
jgi:hypothetical protein